MTPAANSNRSIPELSCDKALAEINAIAPDELATLTATGDSLRVPSIGPPQDLLD